jgi:NADPH:quinone reductase-like Zn-dependent oxidoreductase
MKAVVYEKHDAPNVLVFREVEKPVPNDNELLVKIYAVSVNAGDYRSIKMGIVPKRKIFGSDIAGRVEAVGKSIRQYEVGDDVFGDISACGLGGFAEYVAVPETPLALKPASVSFETAAAVPMAAVCVIMETSNRGRKF